MRPPPPAALRSFVAAARRGVLATVDPAGRPRLVPICFVADETTLGAGAPLVLYSAIDEKPKRSTDPLTLARVRDLEARPEVSVLVDRWDEDWRRLAWVRLACRGELIGPDGPRADEHRHAVAALRAKYPQYRSQRVEARPLIRLDCAVAATWGTLEEDVT